MRRSIHENFCQRIGKTLENIGCGDRKAGVGTFLIILFLCRRSVSLFVFVFVVTAENEKHKQHEKNYHNRIYKTIHNTPLKFCRIASYKTIPQLIARLRLRPSFVIGIVTHRFSKRSNIAWGIPAVSLPKRRKSPSL